MTKTFTKSDLIRYLYREATEKEELEINRALVCDAQLQALYNQLCAIKNQIRFTMLEPSPVTILNILSYARTMTLNAD